VLEEFVYKGCAAQITSMSTRQSRRTIKPSAKLLPPDEQPPPTPSGSKTKTNRGSVNSTSTPSKAGTSTARARTRSKKGDQVREEEQVEQDEGEDDDEEEDPNKLWCICRQPHGGRKMILCDECKDWSVEPMADVLLEGLELIHPDIGSAFGIGFITNASR
jgi:hypothetical protein